MPNKESIINIYGEVTSKESLIEEIQSLLNRLKDSSEETVLNIEMMKTLDIDSLSSIRNSLLAKCGKEIQSNLEWLHSLKDKN